MINFIIFVLFLQVLVGGIVGTLSLLTGRVYYDDSTFEYIVDAFEEHPVTTILIFVVFPLATIVSVVSNFLIDGVAFIFGYCVDKLGDWDSTISLKIYDKKMKKMESQRIKNINIRQ